MVDMKWILLTSLAVSHEVAHLTRLLSAATSRDGGDRKAHELARQVGYTKEVFFQWEREILYHINKSVKSIISHSVKVERQFRHGSKSLLLVAENECVRK